MRILWHSNHEAFPTGYGNQTGVFTPIIKNSGHDIIVSSFVLHGTGKINQHGIIELPGYYAQYGGDIVRWHYETYGRQCIITLVDPFAGVTPPKVYEQMNWHAWTPVDSEPVDQDIAETLKTAKGIWAMSKFGLEQLKRAGFENVTYVPHGVDSKVFFPMNRKEAALKLEKDINKPIQGKFVVMLNAANKGVPSRKAFWYQLAAFKLFSDKHDDAILYLHTDLASPIGENLNEMMVSIGISPDKVYAAPQYHYIIGSLTQDYLNHWYNIADVLLHATMGEGFGISQIEAQMCGTPVIGTKFSSMPELNAMGWLVNGEVYMPHPIVTQRIPNVGEIVQALEYSYEARDNAKIRKQCHDFAMQYDAMKVYNDYMQPALNAIEAALPPDEVVTTPSEPKTDRRRRKLAKLQKHNWSKTGVYGNDGSIYVPCTDAGCAAAKHISKNGNEMIEPDYFDMLGMDIEDDPNGGVAKIICHEIKHSYKLDDLSIADNDNIIDIGAHVGIVSIYLAKKYPAAHIYAYEPMSDNFARLQRNLIKNNVSNVHAFNKAVTSDGEDITLYGSLSDNSGGSSMFGNGAETTAQSVTLKQIFEDNNLAHCKLLKIDCEGAEYEILEGADEQLKLIDAIRGEFHFNNILGNPAELVEYCRSFVPDTQVTICQIGNVDENSMA